MNLREANLEAQRRWGPCGCAYLDLSAQYGSNGGGYTVGILVPLGTMMLGIGRSWEEAFADVLPRQTMIVSGPVRCGAPSSAAPTVSDDQIRDMAAPSPDVDPKYRIAVERVEAAMRDALRLGGNDAPSEVLVAITGFILAERTRT